MENSLLKFYRINFLGRPYELNKLILNRNCILENKEQCSKIIQAYNLHYGLQYFGSSLSLGCMFVLNLYVNNKNRKYIKLTLPIKLGLFTICLTPLCLLYIYSHFVYWDLIKDIIISTRKNDLLYYEKKKYKDEDFKIVYNVSTDLHKYINNNIGLLRGFQVALIFIFKI